MYIVIHDISYVIKWQKLNEKNPFIGPFTTEMVLKKSIKKGYPLKAHRKYMTIDTRAFNGE